MPLSGSATTGNPYDDAGGDWLPAGVEGSFSAAPIAKKGGGFDLAGLAGGVTGILGGFAGLGSVAGMGADVAKAAMGGTAALATSNASPFYNNANISFGDSRAGTDFSAGPNSASATASAGDPSRMNAGGYSPQSASSGGLNFGGLSGSTLAIGAAVMGILIVGILFLFGRK